MMRLVGVFLLFFLASLARAENLGTLGETYPLDRDGREQLKDRARAKEKNGELDAYWKNYRQKMIEAIKHPPPLGVKSDYAVKRELHELRFVLPQDYRDDKVRVVAEKGTVIEPLKIQPLRAGMIFIDGRDQRQIDYAIAVGRHEPMKIVLTAGSPLELRVRYQDAQWRVGRGIPFYFDQKKMIINSLKMLYGINIDSVPVAVYQRGDKLALDFGMPPR